MLCGFTLSVPQRNWQPSLARKTKQCVLHTHKEVLKVLFRIRIKNEILHRKIQERNLRTAQNLGHWWFIFPLESKYHSPLVSPLVTKELWPLRYWLLQIKIHILSFLSKSAFLCWRCGFDWPFSSEKSVFSKYCVRLNILNYNSWLVNSFL